MGHQRNHVALQLLEFFQARDVAHANREAKRLRAIPIAIWFVAIPFSRQRNAQLKRLIAIGKTKLALVGFAGLQHAAHGNRRLVEYS